MTCPFCEPETERVFFEDANIRCLWDRYPVTPGHALVVPRRHFSSWFEATLPEKVALLEGLDMARSEICRNHDALGFNIGINDGEAAGQTIPHLHIHLIPRYVGDVSDPTGGVRNVIPGQGNYLAPKYQVRDSTVPDFDLDTPNVFGNEANPLLNGLKEDLSAASTADFAVAFVTWSGLKELTDYLLDFFDGGGCLRFLTGDYQDFTEPSALKRLLDWVQEYPGQVDVRVFETDSALGFHPKAYLIQGDFDSGVAYIGSSNITRQALTRGLEWNQRLTGIRDDQQLYSIRSEFERLFTHPGTTELTHRWIEAYAKRRKPPVDPSRTEPIELPTPHPIQEEALQALRETRNLGNAAGLVVMATGLGKTWLAAFDSVNFKRVLFVAHREEILKQALNTFRKIRPDATLGLYGGGRHDRDADVLFASIQTLGRENHLNQFQPARFDYIVVDEFHHAAARTYRRLIDHFDPQFLIGLTATPERTDGGDLLGLCGENLVFRCDVMDGIRRELLAPFQYFGVPDEVDFANIPWRRGSFNPEALENAVATDRRARNAYEQWRKRGQTRTLAFCVSKLHADFMASFFRAEGAKAVAVHSGGSSAPRTRSLEDLDAGRTEIVFAVDMFNEGVDVPAIDTVMMLRPTESKILWLQQFGRGLRRSENKSHLTVIDYIGNHRTFLQVPMLLLTAARSGPGQISMALQALERGELELPPGCSVEYELEALNILKGLARPSGIVDQITDWYRSFRALQGHRPLASEAFHEGYKPSSTRKAFGSWLGFVKAQGDLTDAAEQAFDNHREFLAALETTPMTRSFKMVMLLGMMAKGRFPGSIAIDDLADQVIRLGRRIDLLRAEFGDALDNSQRMRKLLEENPIPAWVEGKGTKGVKYFSYEAGLFSSFDAHEIDAEALSDLTQEICDWRLAQYLERLHGETRFASRIICNVSHTSGRPILFLPDRNNNPGIPEGWTPVDVDGERYEAKFAKIAVNVFRGTESEENQLPKLLRSLFGEEAGRPGTNQKVIFEFTDGILRMRPVGVEAVGAQLWLEYSRPEIPTLWGLEFSTARWNQGFVSGGENLFLLVTLDKQGMLEEHQYGDRFLSPDLFQWVSQNRTRRETPTGRKIANHASQGIDVHLFVRDKRKTPKGTAASFIYCGPLEFVDWEGDAPITVRWRLSSSLPDSLRERFRLSAG